jgi:hypothetical protein
MHKAGWLSKQNAQVVADVIIGLAEVAATAGGGALIEKAMDKACKAAVEAAVAAAVNAAKDSILAAAKAAVSSAVARGVTGVSEDAIVAQMTQAVETAAREAAQMTSKQFLKQASVRLIASLFGNGLRDAAETAAREAADLTVKGLKELLVESINIEASDAEAVTSGAAFRATANVAKKSTNQLKNEFARTALAAAGRRAAFTSIGAIANTNMLVDSANAIQQADGKKLDASAMEAVTITLQVVQEIIQMIAMMLGGGFFEQAEFKAGSSVMMAQRGMNAVQSMAMLTSAVSSYGLGSVEEKQGTTTTSQQIIASIASVLHSFLDEIQKDANKGRSLFIEQQAAEVKSQMALSGHLYDGTAAGINVLVSGAA